MLYYIQYYIMSGVTIQNHNSGQHQPKVNKTAHEQKADFERIIQYYLENNKVWHISDKISELEIRFNTDANISKPISKIDYDNVVKQLYTAGFIPEHEDGIHMLRIQNQFIDTDGKIKMSNIRAEIIGLDLIQEYCRTNSLPKLIDMPSTTYNKLKFTQKMLAISSSGEKIRKVKVPDFNFKVSYQTEQDYPVQSQFIKNRRILETWNDSLKIFRSMNRVRFVHPDLPIFADMTVIKTSKYKLDRDKNEVYIPEYTIQESGLFNEVERYEVELEMDNSRIGTGTDYNTHDKLMLAIRKCIRIILSGIQNTKFPISYTVSKNILQSYMQLLHANPEIEQNPILKRKVISNDFIGPGSVTLQMEHILDNTDTNLISQNINTDYTVTDKADGDRSLLYINTDGRIYLITTNMNVIFTGTKTNEKTIFNSLLDGELIKYDKNGKYINLYAAFDVYYIREKSVRELPFLSPAKEEEEMDHRLGLLYKLVDVLNPYSILDTGTGEVQPNQKQHSCGFRVQCKSFEYNTNKQTIYDGCSKILAYGKDGNFEYNTDGLIFTPAYLAVGSNSISGKPGPKFKHTWKSSFKWKPPEYNTIDFLVTSKKNKLGKDEVHHIFENGTQLESVQSVSQYKTLVLRCGFSEQLHGNMNAYQVILDDMISNTGDKSETEYKPVPFHPTEPRDPYAHLCNIMLIEDNGRMIMQTEEGDTFNENMIVEFKYVTTNKAGWKWIPIRVRYDKTTELLSGITKNYGNSYLVANSNWHSIHNPITDQMISSGLNIPDKLNDIDDDDVYYSQVTEETSTQPLRDFHNRYVKSKLISAVSNRNDTLIDYAVGRGGDLHKWSYSNLKFVFGIDVSYNNIHDHTTGACTRYVNERKKHKVFPDALFIKSDSRKNIRSTEDVNTSVKDKQIINAVFGSGAKDITTLGKGVYKNYGIGESGFNISSCQFAMHYFFESIPILHSFLRNLAECTKVNGYFIGTCYDGNSVFDLLSSKQQDEGISIFKNERKIYEITKKYDKTGFPDDELSINYGIDIYQESINKPFREYLVNFSYFTRLMEDYGFVLITDDEAAHMHLPNSTGLFDEMFTHMENDIKIRPRSRVNYRYAPNMSIEEKQISFMNRYFVFKKIRSVDAKKIGEIIEKDIPEMVEQKEQEQEEIPKPIVKKTQKKIVLKTYEVDQDKSPVKPDIIAAPKLKIIGRRD